MKMVIEVPDGCYEELCKATFPAQDTYRLVAWICDGTPLPKGHGRLIDADALIRVMEDRAEKLKGDRDLYDASVIVTAVDMLAPTIIEADKGDEQE